MVVWERLNALSPRLVAMTFVDVGKDVRSYGTGGHCLLHCTSTSEEGEPCVKAEHACSTSKCIFGVERLKHNLWLVFMAFLALSSQQIRAACRTVECETMAPKSVYTSPVTANPVWLDHPVPNHASGHQIRLPRFAYRLQSVHQ
jgi:hypothetical protein